MATLLYQGHSSFRITTDSGRTIYIDPFINKGFNAPADLVLITHEHFDHNNIDIVPMTNHTVVHRSGDMLVDGEYKDLNIGGVHVTAVPASNKNHPVTDCVGYLVDVDGKSLYFAGDTSYMDSMRDLAAIDLDYAFLPCDGVFNMDIAEAEKCAAAICAEHTVPIHTAPTSSGDDCKFDEAKAAAFTANGKLVLRPGDEIEL